MNTQSPAQPTVDTAAAAPRVRRVLVARTLWMVFAAAAIALAVAGVADQHDALLDVSSEYERSLGDVGISGSTWAIYMTSLGIIAVLVHVLIASVIAWRRPDDWMAVFVTVALLANGAINPFSPVHGLAEAHPAFEPPVRVLAYFAILSSISILYLFPTGRFAPAWTLPVALVWALVALPAVFFPDSPLSLAAWPAAVQMMLLVALAASGLYAQLHRYVKVSSPLQQQQAKWAALGLMAAAAGPIAYFFSFEGIASLSEASVPNIVYRRVGSDVFTVTMMVRMAGINFLSVGLLLFPLTFAIAIMRFRLWDIGVVVNRTLVYGALTATIVAVYTVFAVLLQLAFRAVTDQGGTVAIVVSTLAIAALFQPIRRRVQYFIDRRFYRRNYDAVQALAGFANTLWSEVDLEKLGHELEAVAEETVQPAHVSLWLREPEPGAREGPA